MSRRDAWLFATLGWDPTWQRRVPARIKAAWIVAVVLLGTVLGALTTIATYLMPKGQRWVPLVIMLFGVVVINGVQVVLRRELLDRLDAEEDQRAAQRIQARLVPSALPGVPGIDLAGHYSPFRLIGGDFYDVVRVDETRLLVAMADVSGKGTGAALLTANLQALLRFAVSQEHPGLERVAAAMNAHLFRHMEPGRFVTMVLAEIDLRARRLRYVNAGHNPPLGLTPDGWVLRLEGTGLPLGMLAGSTYASAEIEIPAGSALLFYTDGLSERPNPEHELFGEERILAVLRASSGKPAKKVAEALLRDAQVFASGAAAEDDVALLVLRSL